MDVAKYQSHAQMIGWEAATEIGLTIEYAGNRRGLAQIIGRLTAICVWP